MIKIVVLAMVFMLAVVWNMARKNAKEAVKLEHIETIVVGGGCFWGLEYWLQRVPGVVDTEVGFAGGQTLGPTYRDVVTGETGHAEVVKVVFDKNIVSLDRILNVFMRAHIPTTLNAQKNDVGTQYRSVILINSQDQADAAIKAIKEFDLKGGFDKPAVTEVTKLKIFTEADESHQDYLKKNPSGYQCHVLRGEYK